MRRKKICVEYSEQMWDLRYNSGYVLGCDAVESGRYLPKFREGELPASSGLNNKFPATLLNVLLDPENVRNMSLRKSVNFYDTIWLHSPEDSILR
jgi:hypothetical protein